MSTSLGRIASGTVWMANLSAEEPDALVRARPGLWEPWVGNDPGPPGPRAVGRGCQSASVSTFAAILHRSRYERPASRLWKPLVELGHGLMPRPPLLLPVRQRRDGAKIAFGYRITPPLDPR